MRVVETNVWNSLLVDCIDEMIDIAAKESVTATQKLNSVVVMVNGDSDRDLVFRDQQRCQSGYIEGPVGPYPKPELSEDDLANDAYAEERNAMRRANEAYQQAEKQKAAKRTLYERLQSAPELTLKDKAGWLEGLKNNTDAYGAAVYVYAGRWAQLMQAEIAQGKALADIASQTSHDADIEGITGFMYGCAVAILAQCWIHGEELRRWHNKDTQIGTEGDAANESGGVLNPAILNIGGKQ
jgi:hypothetical protein